MAPEPGLTKCSLELNCLALFFKETNQKNAKLPSAVRNGRFLGQESSSIPRAWLRVYVLFDAERLKYSHYFL